MDEYAELRRIAARLLRNERIDHSLQATALVHEAYLKVQAWSGLADLPSLERKAVLARAMRRALVDHARNRNALKRGGPNRGLRVSLDEAFTNDDDPHWVEVLELDMLLRRLEEFDAKAARIVELRFYGGLTEAEVADHFGHTQRWAQKKWAWTRGWLRKELAHS